MYREIGKGNTDVCINKEKKGGENTAQLNGIYSVGQCSICR